MGSAVGPAIASADTSSSAAPVISNVVANPVFGGTSATISWMTDIPADTQVKYGTTTSYGILSALTDSGTPVTSHELTLSGLTPSTLYHFAVMSSASTTNASTTSMASSTPAASSTPMTPSISADMTFLTLGASTSPLTSTSTATSTAATSTATSTPDLTALSNEIRDLESRVATLEREIASLLNGGSGWNGTSTPVMNPGSAMIDQDGKTFMAGGQIDFGGHGFDHETNVIVSLNGSQVAAAHADDGGNFSTGSLTLPAKPGTYTYEFMDSGGKSTQATVTLK